MFIFSAANDGSVRASLTGAIYSTDLDDLMLCLSQNSSAPVDLWVSSPGGDLSAAMGMRAALASHSAPVSIHCSGAVASAATVLLCNPAAKVYAHAGSVFMMHACSAVAAGNAGDLRSAAGALEVFDDELVKLYALRLTAYTDDQIRAMLDDETWTTAQGALDLGLVDEIITESAPVAEIPVESPNEVEEKRDDEEPVSDKIAQIVAAYTTKIAADLKASMSDAFAENSAKIGARLDAVEASLADNKKSFSRVTASISRAYAIDSAGDLPAFTVHDDASRKPFKLNTGH